MRAELLVSSGVQYSVDSVEFGLCREHFSRSLAFDISYKEELLSRVNDILILTKFTTLTNYDANGEFRKSNDRVESILAIIDPVRNEKTTSKRNKEKASDDGNKKLYLDALSQGKPFGSLSEILGSIKTLNKYISVSNANS